MTMATEIFQLTTLSIQELREKYQEVWGEPTNSRNKQYLLKKIAWRLREENKNGISEAARKRALEIANLADLRVRPRKGFDDELAGLVAQGREEAQNSPERSTNNPLGTWDPRLPGPGSVITKEYQGRTIEVLVQGVRQFEWEGLTYRSLSAIAREITGTNYNGFMFFGLGK
jgi:hypothetical protein